MENRHLKTLRNLLNWQNGGGPQHVNAPTFGDINLAIAAAIRDAEQPQMAWHPIETHPGWSDPCLVLIKSNSDDTKIATMSFFNKNGWDIIGHHDFDDIFGNGKWQIIAWMPLPSVNLPFSNQDALNLSPAEKISAEYDALAAQITREYIQSLEARLQALEQPKSAPAAAAAPSFSWTGIVAPMSGFDGARGRS